jgi:DNA modification methylase
MKTRAMRDTILYGDCRNTLPLFDEPARMCVTSPPYYGLRDYGGEADQIGQEETPEEYVANLVEIFSKVRDCLTDDGTLWVNIGDSYAAKSMGDIKPKDLIGIPWMLAFALRADGWYLRQDIIWHKPNPMPENVKDRCTKSHEYLFLFSKQKKYFFDHEAMKEKATGERWGGNKPMNLNNTKDTDNQFSGLSRARKMLYETRNKRSVWSVLPKPYAGAHFAVYPPELIEPCIKAGSERGDIVLDPFMGSGTTAMTARALGRDYIGCELHEGYGKLIQSRVLSAPDPQLPIF